MDVLNICDSDDYPLFDEKLYKRVAHLESLTQTYLEQQALLTRALSEALRRIHELEANNTNTVERDGSF